MSSIFRCNDAILGLIRGMMGTFYNPPVKGKVVFF